MGDIAYHCRAKCLRRATTRSLDLPIDSRRMELGPVANWRELIHGVAASIRMVARVQTVGACKQQIIHRIPHIPRKWCTLKLVACTFIIRIGQRTNGRKDFRHGCYCCCCCCCCCWGLGVLCEQPPLAQPALCLGRPALFHQFPKHELINTNPYR